MTASIVMAIYVDDGLIIGESKEEIQKVLKRMKNLLEIKAFEEPKIYLGMEMKQARNMADRRRIYKEYSRKI